MLVVGLNDRVVYNRLCPYFSEQGYRGEEGSKQEGEYNVLLKSIGPLSTFYNTQETEMLVLKFNISGFCI